jgi:hypothetical protein
MGSIQDSQPGPQHRKELVGGCTNNQRTDVCHGECEIPNPVDEADRVRVEKHVANLVSTAMASAVSDGAADDCSCHFARVVLAVMDVAETSGRPMIIVFSDESLFCLDSDRR